jgi:uncharacterized heparinase superfamily protein
VGDYFVASRGGDRLIFDAGDVGPDHLPAHSHADLLGFEMSLAGERAVVDSGVFAYTGAARADFRSSRAHNVLVVDDEELADCWSSFRMGRRGHVVARASGRTAEGTWVVASHDAYAHRGIDRVSRCWFFAEGNGPWFSMHVVRGRSTRTHESCERIHWHPDHSIDLDGQTAVARGSDRPYLWECAGESTVRCVAGKYSPSFYRAASNRVLEIRCKGALPILSAWSVTPGADPIHPTASLDGDVLILSWMQRSRRKTTCIPLADLDRAGGSPS